jgi:hypothetical protein
MNNSCYRFEKYIYTDGILNDSVDATYILHLEGNGRLDDIKNQLTQYHPSNIVYIVYNSGFKKCNKSLKLQNSVYDLIDANLNIFEHSNINNYSNILILEDDFIFSSNMKNMNHINNINKYLVLNKSNSFVYNLGCIPFFLFPTNLFTYRVIAIGMHATVFSKSAREYIINDKNNVNDWDIYMNMNMNRYMYYKPLCYQLFPNTENSKNWINGKFYLGILQFFNLDRTPEPGTSYIYILAKIFSFILFLFIILIIYILLSYLKVFKVTSRLFRPAGISNRHFFKVKLSV